MKLLKRKKYKKKKKIKIKKTHTYTIIEVKNDLNLLVDRILLSKASLERC